MARFWERRRSDEGSRTGMVSYDREELARLNTRFMALDRQQRRAIMRAVNRGLAVEDRRHADLAIGVARRQQRFWRYAWLLGPTIALAQAALTPIGVQEGLLLAGWGTMLLGGMAWWWHSRAARAELANAALVRRRPGSGRRGDRHRGTVPDAPRAGRRPRLPGGPVPEPSLRGTDEDLAHDDRDVADDDESSDRWAGPGRSRPPRPRGRKRR
jgi:hypothetical protein